MVLLDRAVIAPSALAARSTLQAWAETFIAELNDTHVEHQLRAMKVPPLLELSLCQAAFHTSTRRLLVLGFNAGVPPVAPLRRLPPSTLPWGDDGPGYHGSAVMMLHCVLWLSDVAFLTL